MNWNEQGSKIRLRVQHIQQSSAPIKLNIHTYNTRVVPVTSYVAQLLPIPQDFLQLERAMLHTVLRLPQNALCHADFLHLDKIGGTACRSFTAASTAALIRTALKTVTGWKIWISQLHEAAQRFLPLEPLVRGLLTTSLWDSPPLLSTSMKLPSASPTIPTGVLISLPSSIVACSPNRSKNAFTRISSPASLAIPLMRLSVGDSRHCSILMILTSTTPYFFKGVGTP